MGWRCTSGIDRDVGLVMHTLRREDALWWVVLVDSARCSHVDEGSWVLCRIVGSPMVGMVCDYCRAFGLQGSWGGAGDVDGAYPDTGCLYRACRSHHPPFAGDFGK